MDQFIGHASAITQAGARLCFTWGIMAADFMCAESGLVVVRMCAATQAAAPSEQCM
jgi:hypothetical protein